MSHCVFGMLELRSISAIVLHLLAGDAGVPQSSIDKNGGLFQIGGSRIALRERSRDYDGATHMQLTFPKFHAYPSIRPFNFCAVDTWGSQSVQLQFWNTVGLNRMPIWGCSLTHQVRRAPTPHQVCS